MKRLTIGIVGSGPRDALPDLSDFKTEVDVWIGADRGALHVMEANITLNYAIGDFDSVEQEELERIKNTTENLFIASREKDETDLELALHQAFALQPMTILMFGVTAGRKDHELINIQLLYKIIDKGMKGKIIDKQNILEVTQPGDYEVEKDPTYPYISFIPFSQKVEGLSLEGFRYPLQHANIEWGSTLCISNEISSNIGNFSYRRGILLLIKSRDSN